jgi:hypothetical protein
MLLGLYRDGVREERVLALCSAHGQWVNWQN